MSLVAPLIADHGAAYAVFGSGLKMLLAQAGSKLLSSAAAAYLVRRRCNPCSRPQSAKQVIAMDERYACL